MGVRQEKFAGIIQQHLAEVFQRHPELVGNQFITISKIEVSPDLGYAKVFLSFFKPDNRQALLSQIELNSREIRHQLAGKIRNQARVVPELSFFEDNSLDYVFHMEQVLKKISEEDERKRNENSDNHTK